VSSRRIDVWLPQLDEETLVKKNVNIAGEQFFSEGGGGNVRKRKEKPVLSEGSVLRSICPTLKGVLGTLMEITAQAKLGLAAGVADQTEEEETNGTRGGG